MGNSSVAKPGTWLSWISLLLTILLLVVGVYYLMEKISLAEIGEAFSQVRPVFLGLSILSILLTFGLKAWRWQFLLSAQTKTLPLAALFWAMMLGFYVNNVLPFVRLGEIARVYALNFQTGAGKVQSLSTLFVEKVLETVFLGVIVVLMLPLLILPETIQQSQLIFWLGGTGLAVLLVLYLLAYRADWTLKQFGRISSFLPFALGGRLRQLAASSLKGLSALRERRLFLMILGISFLLSITSILTPYFLFPAFGIPLGLAEAATIHVVISLALVPPSTPAKIGIFDGAVAFLLVWFGLKNEALIAAYTILFHLVIILPQIIFGSIAASQTGWRWRATAVSPSPPPHS
jgi:uncharacterized protein (TIRG00374 family)